MIEITWIFTQTSNQELPHYLWFGTMPRIVAEGICATVEQSIALLQIVREEGNQIGAFKIMAGAFRPSQQNTPSSTKHQRKPLKTFLIPPNPYDRNIARLKQSDISR